MDEYSHCQSTMTITRSAWTTQRISGKVKFVNNCHIYPPEDFIPCAALKHISSFITEVKARLDRAKNGKQNRYCKLKYDIASIMRDK